MIKEFVDAYYEKEKELREKFTSKHPENYMEVVRNVIAVLPGANHHKPDIERIHEIDDGDYQGTLVYVIATEGYQPNTYWYIRVGYGSCSGCDTLEGIWEYSDDPPNEEQVKDYMMLALHIVQGLKQMSDEEA